MFQPRPISKTYLMILGFLIGIILISSLSLQSKSTTDTSVSARQRKVDYLSKVVKLLYKENLVLYEGIENFYLNVASNITEVSKVKIDKNMKNLQLNFKKIAKNIENLG